MGLLLDFASNAIRVFKSYGLGLIIPYAIFFCIGLIGLIKCCIEYFFYNLEISAKCITLGCERINYDDITYRPEFEFYYRGKTYRRKFRTGRERPWSYKAGDTVLLRFRQHKDSVMFIMDDIGNSPFYVVSELKFDVIGWLMWLSFLLIFAIGIVSISSGG